MLDTRHANIEFLGKDGFQWFIAQVAPDKVWRTENNQNFSNGFRAKIRILGYHPGENDEEGGISDENLPWAHFLVSPQFGAGNNNTGTSFALQGGEMVVGFFLDGEEAQQPVIIGSFFANWNIDDVKDYKTVLANGTTGFSALSIDPSVKNADSTELKNDEATKKSGVVIDSNSKIVDKKGEKKDTKLKHLDNLKKEITVSSGSCDSKDKMSNVSKTMQKLFDTVNKLEKFSDGYIDPVLGRLVDVDELIDKASDEIAGAMSGIIRGVRYKAFEKINKIVDKTVNYLNPSFLTSQIAAKKMKDGFYCAMENIIKGLKSFVGKFLKELLGKLVNVPLCAAEQFLGGLISGLTSNIQSAVGPILGSLSAFTGSAMPNISGMLTSALGRLNTGLKLFDCTGGECPQSYDFYINQGRSPKNPINISGVLDKVSKLSTVKNISDRLVDLSFPNAAGIGTTVGSASGSSPLGGLVGGCNVSSKTCLPPRVVIFGGQGIGAAADAVVSEIGEVIGVRMQDLGTGYTEPPFVSIVDDCDIGRGATATAIVEDGKVVNIVVNKGGANYLSGDQIADVEGFDVIGEVEGVEVVATGAGYEEGDLIVSDSGQTLKPIIENGRIVGASGKIDQGLSTIPSLTIDSNTGVGAVITPITRFVKREAYADPIVPQSQIITVISCPRFY